MTAKVTVIDYGVGNLLKVSRALAAAGGEVVVSGDPAEVERAERLVLPGVGSFSHGMDGLRARGMLDAIDQYRAAERPFLGICLGMQMMLGESEEFGNHAGIGLIPGRVRAIPRTTSDGLPHKIPLIGWMELARGGTADWRNCPLRDVAPGSAAYFVHSFAAEPDDPAHLLATVDYHGRTVCAAVGRDNLFGCQFHPEMSSAVGLRILHDFLAW